MVAPKKTKLVSFLAKSIDQRISNRNANHTLKHDFQNLIKIPRKNVFSGKEAAKILNVTQSEIKKGIYSREELMQMKKKNEFSLSSGQAFNIFKKISTSGKSMSYDSFVDICKKMKMFDILGEGKKTSLRVPLSRVLTFVKKFAELKKWDTPKELSKKIGLNERRVLYNLHAEKRLLEQCFFFGVQGGWEVRIPPKVVSEIIARQSDFTTKQAVDYLNQKGLKISYSGFMKLPKKKIRLRAERGFDNSIRVTQEELDKYLRSKGYKVETKVEIIRNERRSQINYTSERIAFINRLAKGFLGDRKNAEVMFERMVGVYKKNFKKLPANPDSIATAINRELGKHIGSYQPIYNFATWVFAYKWKEIIESEASKHI